MKGTTLRIDGMSCGHCVNRVQAALAAVDGASVQHVAVGRATVEYDESRVSPMQLATAVSDAGYPAVAE